MIGQRQEEDGEDRLTRGATKVHFQLVAGSSTAEHFSPNSMDAGTISASARSPSEAYGLQYFSSRSQACTAADLGGLPVLPSLSSAWPAVLLPGHFGLLLDSTYGLWLLRLLPTSLSTPTGLSGHLQSVTHSTGA